MKLSWSLAVGIPGLVLMLWVGPSWGQGTNPTNSDPLSNTAGGTAALVNNLNRTNGTENTAFGEQALRDNTIGSDNTAVGADALQNNTSGENNTAVGAEALENNMTGNNNTAVGFQTLHFNTTGIANTASGFQALALNTTGDGNTASGNGALFSNTTGEANTASGISALVNNTTGNDNTASGFQALALNTTGNNNAASGFNALFNNTTGNFNTAIGNGADVSVGDLSNATAIGSGATVNASNNIRLGNAAVTVIEGQVAFTASSDKTQKENFQPVDGEEVLGKIRGFELSSWNFIGHDPKQFRHYGPMAQDFFAAFGHDGLGQIGSETTISSGDLAGILMIAVQALEKRTAELKQKEARIALLESRLEALELRENHFIQITAEKSLGGNIINVMP
jgi:trimeric autotransporter adhesin